MWALSLLFFIQQTFAEHCKLGKHRFIKYLPFIPRIHGTSCLQTPNPQELWEVHRTKGELCGVFGISWSQGSLSIQLLLLKVCGLPVYIINKSGLWCVLLIAYLPSNQFLLNIRKCKSCHLY